MTVIIIEFWFPAHEWCLEQRRQIWHVEQLYLKAGIKPYYWEMDGWVARLWQFWDMSDFDRCLSRGTTNIVLLLPLNTPTYFFVLLLLGCSFCLTSKSKCVVRITRPMLTVFCILFWMIWTKSRPSFTICVVPAGKVGGLSNCTQIVVLPQS